VPGDAHRPGVGVDKSPAKKTANATEEEVAFSGTVLDPDGKPVVGAVIALGEWNADNTQIATELTKTDDSGRFRCAVPALPPGQSEYRTLVARAAGFAAVWVELRQLTKPGQEAELRLAKAEVPVRGRVLTLEGRPIPGAVVRVGGLSAPDGKKGLKEVYQKWPDEPYEAAHLLKKTLSHLAAAGLPEQVTTDADGRFEIMGVGDGRLLTLEIKADTIQHQYVRVAVDAGFDPKTVPPAPEPRRIFVPVGPLYGPRFDHAANPCRVITGTVTDQKTGKPLANVGVNGTAREVGWENHAFTKTGADGKYRLFGLPNVGCELDFIHAGKDSRYLMLTKTVGPTPGLSPATCDMALVRGMVVTGRVTDRDTGKPIKASLHYALLFENKHLQELPGEDINAGGLVSHPLDADGRFRVVAPPGLAVLLVQAHRHDGDEKPYAQAQLKAEDRDKPYFRTREGMGVSFKTANGMIRGLRGWNAYQVIDPAPGTEAATVDFRLDPAIKVTVTGTIVDPDGKPVTGASIESTLREFQVQDLPTAEFRIPDFDPQQPRAFFFRHRDKNLGAAVVLNGDESKPVTVRLQQCATLAGRLVDEDGLPRPSWITGIIQKGQLNNDAGVSLFTQKTEKDGRFRIEGVITGLQFGLHAGKSLRIYDQNLIPEMTLKAGEVKDLGDLIRKEPDR
jgi:uncharacterized GH25 family protein